MPITVEVSPAGEASRQSREVRRGADMSRQAAIPSQADANAAGKSIDGHLTRKQRVTMVGAICGVVAVVLGLFLLPSTPSVAITILLLITLICVGTTITLRN